MTPPRLVSTDRLDLTFAPAAWPFALERRGEIDTWFAELQRRKPAIWNGRVLLLHRHERRDGVFRGEYLETDYASFVAWRDWGRPAAGVADCFGAGAVISADGAVLVGVMGAHTANAGHIYFPAGTPDPGDVVDGRVDLAFSVARELKEETGLDSADFVAAPGWLTVIDGALIAQIKILHSRLTAAELRARVLAYLAAETQPELADVRMVRGPADVDAAMLPFVLPFLEAFFAGRLAK